VLNRRPFFGIDFIILHSLAIEEKGIAEWKVRRRTSPDNTPTEEAKSLGATLAPHTHIANCHASSVTCHIKLLVSGQAENDDEERPK
jgi:hypothetical protein